MIVELIIQGAGLGNEDFRTDLHFTDYIKGDKGDKGDALTFEDFTPEQIEVLQQPATEAAEESRKVSNEISDVEEKRATVEQNRVTAEGTRNDNEAKRVTTERTRVESETGRIDKEKERVSAETSRVSAEQNRTLAEDRRRQEHSVALKESGAATTKADSAAEHATEVAAGIDGRMTEAEAELFQLRTEMPLKADLDPVTKTVPSAQIAPLQGLQTGVDCTNGHFGGSAFLYPNITFSGDRTTEVLFTVNENIDPLDSNTVLALASSNRNLYISVLGTRKLLLGCGGQIPAIQGIPIGPGKQLIHIVASTVFSTKETTFWMNGVFLAKYIGNELAAPPQFIIGRFTATINRYKCGDIHNVRAFNYALSEAECQLLWNNGDPLNYMLPHHIKILSPAVDLASRSVALTKSTLKNNRNYVDEGVAGYFAEPYGGKFREGGIIPNGLMKITYDIDIYEDYTVRIACHGKLTYIKLVHGSNIGTVYLNTSDGSDRDPNLYLDFRTLPYVPDGVIINNITIERVGCVAEYLPCGLLPDKWRDTSGNGNDIAAVGTPQLVYQRPAYARAMKTISITVDTPVLWDNTQCTISDDTITKTDHGLRENDVIQIDVVSNGTDPVPASIRDTDEVFYVHIIDSNNFMLYNKVADATSLISGLTQGDRWSLRMAGVDSIDFPASDSTKRVIVNGKLIKGTSNVISMNVGFSLNKSLFLNNSYTPYYYQVPNIGLSSPNIVATTEKYILYTEIAELAKLGSTYILRKVQFGTQKTTKLIPAAATTKDLPLTYSESIGCSTTDDAMIISGKIDNVVKGRGLIANGTTITIESYV